MNVNPIMNTQDDQDLTSLLEEINNKSNDKNISYCNKEKSNKVKNSSYNKSTANYTCTNTYTNNNLTTHNIITTNYFAGTTSLSKKVKKNICKENLVMELREELKYNKTFNLMYSRYLEDVIKLKNQVKLNKDKVEENCEKLKKEYADKFAIIDSYEKQIIQLQSDRKNIIKTNDEILLMKNNQQKKLNAEIKSLDSKTEKQRTQIEKLKTNISSLEDRKLHLDEEFEKIKKDEEKQYQKLKKEYRYMLKKRDYFQEAYDEYEKIPEDLVKIDIKLEDHTNAKNALEEENLNIKLVEKNFETNRLMNSINNLNKKIKNFDADQKAKKKFERLFGKTEKNNDNGYKTSFGSKTTRRKGYSANTKRGKLH